MRVQIIALLLVISPAAIALNVGIPRLGAAELSAINDDSNGDLATIAGKGSANGKVFKNIPADNTIDAVKVGINTG